MSTSVALTEPTERAMASGTRQDAGLLVLRLAGFGLLTFHGAQKLFGVFGGPGLSGTTQMFQQMGYEPAGFFALAGGASELVGGLLLVLGFLTPLGAAMSLGVMINAVVAVASNGLIMAGYPIMLATAAVVLAITGPGRYSLDHNQPWQRAGLPWTAVTIGLAVVTAALSLLAKG